MSLRNYVNLYLRTRFIASEAIFLILEKVKSISIEVYCNRIFVVFLTKLEKETNQSKSGALNN